MSVSFIITSYNIENYIIECLESVVICARAGDEIILVDDGSTDATSAKIKTFIASGTLPEDVTLLPIFFGANTFGGVGIAANIGMDHASKDMVFFVDGDDWLNPETFNLCRDMFKSRGEDFMVVNYLTFDQQMGHTQPPADQHRWANIQKGMAPQARLELALSFIAVPWRKFYRRGFLVEQGLRFPEGNFFFEDNPFHWAVCRSANNFSFYNRVICYHRTNRPGQTMASTGDELLAFFTHFETIYRGIDADDAHLQRAAMRWLIGNMAWHLDRLHPSVTRAWGQRAIACFQQFDFTLWQGDVLPDSSDTALFEAVDYLRRGDLGGFLASQQITRLSKQVTELQTQLEDLQGEVRITRHLAETTKNISEFGAHLALGKKQ